MKILLKLIIITSFFLVLSIFPQKANAADIQQEITYSQIGDKVYEIDGNIFYAYNGPDPLIPEPPAPIGWKTYGFNDSGWQNARDAFESNPVEANEWWCIRLPLNCHPLGNPEPRQLTGPNGFIDRITLLFRKRFSLNPPPGYRPKQILLEVWSDNNGYVYFDGARVGDSGIDRISRITIPITDPSNLNRVIAIQVSNDDQDIGNPVGVTYRVSAIYEPTPATISGYIKNSVTNAGIPNILVKILNGATGSEQTTTTNSSGFYSVSNLVYYGDPYAVRPQGTSLGPNPFPPSGYVGPPQSTTNSWAWDYCRGSDTPLGSGSYECQIAHATNPNDCANGSNWGSGPRDRCNFVFDPTPTPTPTTPTITQPPPPTGTVTCTPNTNIATTGSPVTFTPQSSENMTGATFEWTDSDTPGLRYTFYNFPPYSITTSYSTTGTKTKTVRMITGTLDIVGSCTVQIVPPNAISGRVFCDQRRNGVYDAGEDILESNRTVQLSGFSTGSTQTNGSGNYTFGNLVPADYRVTLPLPAGYQPTTSTDQAVDTSIQPIPSIDFGIYKILTSTGDGFVRDLNGNGVRDVPVSISGPINSSTLTQPNGQYSFNNLLPGTYTITVTPPPGYRVVSNGTQTITVNCDGTMSPTTLATIIIDPQASIRVRVFEDTSPFGNISGDPPYAGPAINVNITGSTNISGATTAGAYLSPSLSPGDYTITISIPAEYTATFPSSGATCNPTTCVGGTISVTRTHSTTETIVDFGIARLVSVSGTVYRDDDKDGSFDPPSETGFNGASLRIGNNPTCDIVYNTINSGHTGVAGGFTFANLFPSNYFVCLSVPPGYFATDPVPPVRAANASSGNVTGLLFGISNSTPWWNCQGGDCRIDSGIDDQIVPSASAACGGPNLFTLAPRSNSPGIAFYGTGTLDLNGQQISFNNQDWSAAEDFTPVNGTIKTSYNFIETTARQSGLDINKPLTCDTNNCNLTNHANGLYKVNGDLTMSNSTTRISGNKDIVILVDGNLEIGDGNIWVDKGSTLTISVSGDIRTSVGIGENSPTSICDPDTHAGCNIEGFYSADGNFIIRGFHDCSVATDKKLNISGAVVVNAALNGGAFLNNRDICAGNVSCPTYTFQERPDLVLNAPELLKQQTYIWREIAP